jgi:hypothetical protein
VHHVEQKRHGASRIKPLEHSRHGKGLFHQYPVHASPDVTTQIPGAVLGARDIVDLEVASGAKKASLSLLSKSPERANV